MTKTLKFSSISLLIILFLAYSNLSNAQSWLEKQKKKIEKKIDAVSDDIVKPKKEKEPEIATSIDSTKNINKDNTAKAKAKRPAEQSIIKESDFVQNPLLPKQDPAHTRFKIADNLSIDLKNSYPVGYAPKWRFVFDKSIVIFDIENYVFKTSTLAHSGKSISITNYNGKAVIRFGGLIIGDLGGELYADIVVDGPQAVLTPTPQTFKVTNFQQILNERPSGQKYVSTDQMSFAGGFEGEITLSANENGDINMSLLLESFKSGTATAEAGVSYRYLAKNVNVENEMTPAKANGIVKAEEEAKQRQKDYEAKTTKQADSLKKLIAKKYPQADCKSCFYSSKGSYLTSSTVDKYWVNGYGDASYAGTQTDFDVNTKTVIKNTCKYPLTFVGIQQFYDEENGYYLKDVTKVMDVGYNFSSDQGLFASVLTSMMGAGSEFDIFVQDRYVLQYARVGSVQWLKVIKN